MNQFNLASSQQAKIVFFFIAILDPVLLNRGRGSFPPTLSVVEAKQIALAISASARQGRSHAVIIPLIPLSSLYRPFSFPKCWSCGFFWFGTDFSEQLSRMRPKRPTSYLSSFNEECIGYFIFIYDYDSFLTNSYLAVLNRKVYYERSTKSKQLIKLNQ